MKHEDFLWFFKKFIVRLHLNIKLYKNIIMKLSITLLGLILCISLNAQKDKNVASKWFEGTGGSPAPTAEDFFTAKKGVLLCAIFNDD